MVCSDGAAGTDVGLAGIRRAGGGFSVARRSRSNFLRFLLVSAIMSVCSCSRLCFHQLQVALSSARRLLPILAISCKRFLLANSIRLSRLLVNSPNR